MSFVNKFIVALICTTGLFFSHQAMSAVPGSVSNLDVSADEKSKHVLIHGDIPFLVTLPAKDADGKIFVSWDDVSGATYYQYRICVDGVCESWQETTGSTAGLELPESGNYTVQVRACNNNGCGSIQTTSAIEIIGSISGDGEPETPPTRYTLDAHGGIPAQDANSDAVGAIAGEFRVNESGQATYSIPIFTPTGRAGVQPQVSLSYSSQGGNSNLGLGWGLNAGSAITRCRQTDEIDNNEIGVTLSYDDRFCLDGQRLILATGEYGESGSTYRTELDSQTKVIAKGTAGIGPDYFEVYRKDGSVSYYGNTTDSQLRANRVDSISGTSISSTVLSTVLVWSQSQFVDNPNLASPNTINYHYSTNDSYGEQQLSRITYSPDNEIEFIYQRSFIHGGMGLGGYNRNSQKLTQVIVRDNGNELRKYELAYKTKEQVLYDEIDDGVFGDPVYTYVVDDYPLRLESITESAKSNSGDWVSLQPTQFNWMENTSGYYQGTQLTKLNYKINHRSVGGKTYNGNYQFGDVNADSYQDMVYVNKSNEEISFHTAKSKGVNTNVFGGSFEVLSCSINIGQQKPKSSDFTWSLIDFNADGRSDLFTTDYVSSGKYEIKVYPAIVGGCFSSSPLVSGIYSNSHETSRPQDYTGDGLPDILISKKLYTAQRTGELNTPYTWGKPETLVFEDLPAPPSSNAIWRYSENIDYTEFKPSDFNGDGKTDLVVKQVVTKYCQEREFCGSQQETTTNRYAVTSNGNGTFSTYAWMPYLGIKKNDDGEYIEQFSDINGDGLADYLYKSDSDNYWYYRLNTGKKFLSQVKIIGLGTESYPSYTDYNSDGRIDIAFKKSSKLHILPGTETGFSANSINTGIDIGSDGFISTFADVNGDGIQEHLRLDFSGDAHHIRVDRPKHSNETHRYVIDKVENGMGNVTNITYKPLTHSGLYSKATDSARKNWGASYSCSGDSQVGRDACSPVFDMNGPMYVVSKVTSSSPIKANKDETAGVTYKYGAARMQGKGRGFLGFEWLETTDLQTLVKTKTTYRQDYPYIGSPKKTVVTYNGVKLSEAVNLWQSRVITLASGNKVRFPYISHSSEKKWRLKSGSGTFAAFESEILTQTEYDNYANVTKQITLVSSTERYHDNYGFYGFIFDLDSSIGLTKTVTVNSYSDNLSKWQLGRLSSATVTHSRQGQPDITRASAFEYDSSTGFLVKEIIEPNSSDVKERLTTIYKYDQYGNKILKRTCSLRVSDCLNSTSVNDNDPYHINRWSSTVYDNQGRYPVKKLNAFGQVTSQVITRNSLGQPTEAVSLSGGRVYNGYGAFGHKYFTFTNSGSWSKETKFLCGSNCPSVAVYGIKTVTATGAKSFAYFDALGREVQKAAIHFDGSYAVTATEFNQRGLAIKATEPELQGLPYTNPNGQYSTTTNYDVLGRPELIINPDGGQTSISYYAGYTVTNNPKSQNKSEYTDASGKVTEVKDNLGNSLYYTYNATGDLTSLEFGTNLQSELTYDRLGRKISMLDMDKGGADAKSWTYKYNALGELVEQTDAKGQKVITYRDRLGRTIRRVDTTAGGTVTANQLWTYNNNASGVRGYDVGQLLEEKDLISGYQFNPGYDDLGRVVYTQTIIDDQLYLTDKTFDQYGRVFQSFDAASSEFANAGVRNVYNQYGYLESVHDARGAPTSSNRLRQVSVMDARGNITSELLGNGVETTRTYYEATGLIQSIVSAKGSNKLQDLQYDWDKVGNLMWRIEYDSATDTQLHETFTYDGLNRLQNATHQNEDMSLTYLDNGNIETKSGVGSYTYGGTCNGVTAGPHAVTNAGGKSYCYDSNGNMVSGDGRSMVYSTFDKLTKVTKNSHTTEFDYAPSRSRFKRVDKKSGKTTTTHYIGNVEVIQHSDKSYITYRRNLGGVIQEERTNGTKQASYLHTDHLGSTDVISNASGNVVQSFSFNAFGEQRSHVDWKTYLGSPDIYLSPVSDALTSRGFTGHEQMDEVGLIHMNGRVYDPKLGRFIQADPHIQSPSDSQSLNRYSYVKNNPLSYTDPTGYFFKKLKKAHMKLNGTWAVHKYLANHAPWAVGIIQTALNFIPIVGPVVSAAFGANHNFYLTGSLTSSTKSFIASYYGAQAMRYIGASGMDGFEKVIAHGMVGGIQAELQGGKFGHGFASAAMGKAVTNQFGSYFAKNPATGLVVTAVVGGTSSRISGGKFSNGAVTAAAGYIFNFMQNEGRKMGYGERRDALIEEIMNAYKEEYGFSGQDAKMSLKRMFSYNKNLHGEAEFIHGLDSMTDEQIQLGLRVATVMTLTGEAHELLAKLPISGGVGGVRSMTRTLIKEGHFDLQDIKSNINDNFDDLGTGGAAAASALLNVKGPTGMYRYECAFNRGYCL